MFKLSHLLHRRGPLEAELIVPALDARLPTELAVGVSAFSLSPHLAHCGGYPLLDWEAVGSWVDAFESDHLRHEAWNAAAHAWLLHMKTALGKTFELRASRHAMLLSSLDPNISRATLDYMERTLQRVVKVLDGIGLVPSLGRDLLLVFDDDESYYRYISCYYPDAGEFAFSGGMHIDSGCSHYVTVKNDLRLMEPIIAHEMTHGCLGHLPLPAWLNEGLAVNIEQRIAPTPSAFTPLQLHGKHRAFWGEREIQEFWSGKSFLRIDDGGLLSYALARLVVEQLSRDWELFKRFALAADGADAGAAAAKEHLGVDLGEFVCVLLEKVPSLAWAPDSSQWDSTPERGRFSRYAATFAAS
jgi:hypothetical protein